MLISTNATSEFIALTDLWCSILPRYMASKPLLAKKSGIKGWFSFSFSRIKSSTTDSYSTLYKLTAFMLDISQCSVFKPVTIRENEKENQPLIPLFFAIQVIYYEFNFESGKEYCFVRMWCISSGFCTNEIMSFLDASCSSGDVYWWWHWLRLRPHACMATDICNQSQPISRIVSSR
jgi:hypothetical protein